MDFASLMSAQIAKKKKGGGGATTTSHGSPSAGKDDDKKPADASPPPPPKKYVRIGEAEEQRRAAYLAAQKAREAEREAKAAAKRKREDELAEETRAREEKRRRLAEESRRRRAEREAEEERARRKRLGLPARPAGGGAEESDEQKKKKKKNGDECGIPDMEEAALRAALRAHGEPAALFGETHAQRLRRYARLTHPTALSAAAAAKLPVPTTLLPVEEKDMQVPAATAIPRDPAGRAYLYRQLASYFNLLLDEWRKALAEAEAAASRDRGGDPDAAPTEASRSARTIMEQSRASLTPLFRHLEAGDMDDKILAAVVEIVHAAQARRYVEANDAYLRLSIGKAAWPIGVIMVGIHERSAREKLHGGDKGGVMTDDVTRKYVQSIKRCLTFAQVRWPPDDASQLMG